MCVHSRADAPARPTVDFPFAPGESFIERAAEQWSELRPRARLCEPWVTPQNSPSRGTATERRGDRNAKSQVAPSGLETFSGSCYRGLEAAIELTGAQPSRLHLADSRRGLALNAAPQLGTSTLCEASFALPSDDKLKLCCFQNRTRSPLAHCLDSDYSAT